MFDVNPGFGGPLRRDKAWFYFSAGRATSSKWMADEFYDRTPTTRTSGPISPT